MAGQSLSRTHSHLARALSHGGVLATPLADKRRQAPLPRATRFSARIVIWCRVPGDPMWHEGLTENISLTGVLFRAHIPVPVRPQMGLDVALEIPGAERRDDPVEFHSSAEVVRVEQEPNEILPKVAIALRSKAEEWIPVSLDSLV